MSDDATSNFFCSFPFVKSVSGLSLALAVRRQEGVCHHVVRSTDSERLSVIACRSEMDTSENAGIFDLFGCCREARVISRSSHTVGSHDEGGVLAEEI